MSGRPDGPTWATSDTIEPMSEGAGEPSRGPAPGAATSSPEALALLLEHTDRSARGHETHPAVVAAVVGVERLVALLGTTQPSVLATAVTDGAEGRGTEPVVAATQQSLHTIGVALARVGSGWVADATVVNPETGGHPVATDLGALRAATRASIASYEGVPYYRDRYADRGSRYSLSDSGWLVHLVGAPESVAVHQVHWLSDLLATKGMPTWLMERHLEALVAALHEDGVDVGALPDALESVRARRRTHVSDDGLERAEEWVLRTVTAPPTTPTGRLLAGAVADARAGITRDTSPVMDWLTDPSRTTARDAAALTALHDHLLAAGPDGRAPQP